jgi:hypothetical protein
LYTGLGFIGVVGVVGLVGLVVVEYIDGVSARSDPTSQHSGSEQKNTLLALDSIHIVPGMSGLLTTTSKCSIVTPVIRVSLVRWVTGIVRSRGGVGLGVTSRAGR